jgi:hypothetical protein
MEERTHRNMGMRQDFERRIIKKQQEIVELELQIRDAKSYLQALQDSLKFVPRDATSNGDSTDANLRPGTSLSKAREAIRKTGKPMHINDLLVAIGRAVDKKNKVSLAGSLSNYARKQEIFTKTAPNTFGLKEFDSSTEEQLPKSFGNV